MALSKAAEEKSVLLLGDFELRKPMVGREELRREELRGAWSESTIETWTGSAIQT
jgi:hypothetical protein